MLIMSVPVSGYSEQHGQQGKYTVITWKHSENSKKIWATRTTIKEI